LGNKKESNLIIYPNPFTGKIYLTSSGTVGELIYRLFDANGKLIQSGNRLDNNTNLLIDKPELPAGVYFIEIIEDGSKQMNRLVKF